MMDARLASLLCIVAGEVLTIFAQVRTSTFPEGQQRWLLVGSAWVVSGVFLVLGYVVGAEAFGGVWSVAAVSVTSILIVEPVLLYLLLREWPSRPEAVGLMCGCVGLAVTLA